MQMVAQVKRCLRVVMGLARHTGNHRALLCLQIENAKRQRT